MVEYHTDCLAGWRVRFPDLLPPSVRILYYWRVFIREMKCRYLEKMLTYITLCFCFSSYDLQILRGQAVIQSSSTVLQCFFEQLVRGIGTSRKVRQERSGQPELAEKRLQSIEKHRCFLRWLEGLEELLHWVETVSIAFN